MRLHFPSDIQRLISRINHARDQLEDPDLAIDGRAELLRRLLDVETRVDRFHLARVADPYDPSHPGQLARLDTEITTILRACTPDPANRP